MEVRGTLRGKGRLARCRDDGNDLTIARCPYSRLTRFMTSIGLDTVCCHLVYAFFSPSQVYHDCFGCDKQPTQSPSRPVEYAKQTDVGCWL